MGMIWHDYHSVQVELSTVFPQAALQHNTSGFRWELPPVVGGECNEDWPIVFLNVGKTAAVIILRLHKTAALWAA